MFRGGLLPAIFVCVDHVPMHQLEVLPNHGGTIMAEETTQQVKTGRTVDSAYGFSFSIAVGLILFIAGLVISLTLSNGTSIGLIFGIPLLLAGLVIPDRKSTR